MKQLFALFTILFTQNLLFSQNPIANFTASPTTVCAGDCVTFTSTSTTNGGPAIVQYNWSFGDGGVSGPVPGATTTYVYCYEVPGVYPVTLVAQNASGATDNEFKAAYITVKAKPTAGFTILGASCTVPLTLSFNNTSQTGAGFTYSWNFGNQQTSNLQNPPAQTYSSLGTVNVTLTVNDVVNGCSSTITQPVVVSNYQAGITAPQIACIGQAVTVSDASTAGANSWNWQVTPSTGWSFSNGTSSSSQNPQITFTTAGPYTIQLASQNTISGCSGSTQSQINVQPTPTPSFTGTPTNNCAPSVVTFTNTSTGGVTYTWDFGDGTPTFTGTTPPAHTYSVNGTYDVTLTMTTSTGCSGSTTQPAFITVSDPVASFTADKTGGCSPLGVQFTSTSTSPNPTNNPIVSYSWNFGGGTPNTFNGPNPPVVSYGVGIYSVTLTVTTQSGCTDTETITDYITVGQINSLNISVDSLQNCIKTDFHFTSNVVTTPPNPSPTEITYEWDFTDGTSTQSNPNYQFTSDTGYFDVKLIVDFRGCKDTIEVDSMVYIKAPISKFTPDVTLFCNPNSLPVTLNVADEATHGITTDDILMIWKWGDGTDSLVLDDNVLDGLSAGDASHSYTQYGSYTVEQVIYNYTTGCSDSTTNIIHVSRLTPGLALSNDSVCKNSPLNLTSLSTTWDQQPTPHPISTWVYDMGTTPPLTVNGDATGAGQFTYTTEGNYIITLTATNSAGCSASTSLPITVLNLPFATVATNPDPALGCAPFPVSFTSANSISLNGLPLTSVEYVFSDVNDTIVSNSLTTPVSHTFNAAGTFYCYATVVDQFGCKSSPAPAQISITQPNPFFSVDNVICNGGTINTNNTSTGLEPMTYQWFIDGTPLSTTPNVSATFTESVVGPTQTSATHTVTLVATDANGCKDTIGNLITISIPHADMDTTLSGLTVDQFGNFTCPPVTANFTDESISYGNITNWSWAFGDGAVSNFQDPSNIYSQSGTYTLRLIVTDSYGCKDTTQWVDFLTIGGPEGDPQWVQNAGICAQGAQFVVNNPNNVSSVQWTLGDGTIIMDSLDFIYSYGAPGTYPVSVILFDNQGCQVPTVLNPITVVDGGLTADFTINPNPAEANGNVVFTNTSTTQSGSIVQSIWDFGNGLNSTVPGMNSQNSTYPVGGYYTILLKVRNSQGCVDTHSVLLQVKDPDLFLPNVFSPNGDGANELFTLPFDAFSEFHIVIQNRWGNVVCDRNKDAATPTLLWDGTNNGGAMVADGVYFYQMTGKMYGGTDFNKHGFVTVIEPR